MAKHEVYRDGEIHVLSQKCDTCIFRPGNLMHLAEDRKNRMAAEAVANQSVIPCHKTIYGEDVKPAICRGYWDVHQKDVGLLQAAKRMGIVVYDVIDNTRSN